VHQSSGAGRSYEQKGNLPAATKEFEKARQLEQEAAEIISAAGYAYGCSRNRAEAERISNELKERSKKSNVPSYNIVVVYASLGEKDQAFEWLEKPLQEGSFYISLLKVDPELDNLRSDSRFASLLHRAKLDS